jgi:hypothetical protein
MASKTLAERFLEQEGNLYRQFSPQTNDGSGQPFVTIRPDTDASRSRIKDDSRILPVVSQQRDFNRIKSFINSPSGKLFIGRQLFLQLGNTFGDTKIYNPVSALLNTTPYIHVKRHITIVKQIPGILQANTLDSFTQNRPGGALKSLLRKQLNKIATPLGVSGILRKTPVKDARPEFIIFGKGVTYNPRLILPTTAESRAEVKPTSFTESLKRSLKKSIISGARSLLKKQAAKSLGVPGLPTKTTRTSQYPTQTAFISAVSQFKAKQIQNINTAYGRFNSPYFSGNEFWESPFDPLPKTQVSFDGNNNPVLGNNTQNVGDRLNSSFDTTNFRNTRLNYKTIANTDNDIIKFIFSNGSNNVQFRAFITNFKENVKPEFNEQRYLGRTERYVTYAGARRTATLQFNIVAFSENELTGMWTRINYLTGLAFPRGVAEDSGFMIPPLFKITVGDIYDVQPCYLDSIDFDFIDNDITFDIDRQVSKLINVNMSIVLLEKRSKYYNSPFYNIIEQTPPEVVRARAGT